MKDTEQTIAASTGQPTRHTTDDDQAKAVRILLLEDNLRDAELVLEALGSACRGTKSVHVANRRDFIAALEREEFDIVLSDYSLPAFDGLSALAIVRERFLEIPFIFVSGTIGEELAVECLKAGATDYVLKSKLSRLGQVVLRALDEAHLRAKHQLAEARLRLSEAKSRAIVDNAADGILTIDHCGTIESLNPAAAQIFGYTPAEATGHSIRLLIPRPYLPEHESYCSPISEYRREVLGRHRNGQDVPLEFAISELRHDDRTLFVVLVRDITEWKRDQQELTSSRERLRCLATRLQSIREEEQARIAREVHDVLGQALTGLKIDLRWLKARLSGRESLLRDRANAMLDVIDGTINTVRRIARELRPAVLDNLGLAAAIDWQAKEFQSRTGIECRCAINFDDEDLSIECSTAVFRIFQEALTNVARHAEATVVKVALWEVTGNVVLEVKDNGRGITESKKRESNSLGLLGMRERAYALAGDVEISGAHGQGTTVVVRIPKNYKSKDIT